MQRGKLFFITLAIILFTSFAVFAQQETEPANDSAITGTQIPNGAVRVLPSSVPNEINLAFENLAEAGKGKLVAGEREVLAWTNNYKKSNAAGLMKKIQTEWQANGWQYDLSGSDGSLHVFGLYTQQPKRRAVLGFFVEGDEALVLGLMEVSAVGAEKPQTSVIKTSTSDNIPTNNSAAKVVNVGKDDGYVNVMGNEMPTMPSFPALKPKPGFVRGYVKDWTGKPLAGAAIGIRASYFAGMYSGAQGKTDAKGYYEFSVPKGSAHYYNAGYTIEYGGGLAALGLHPADGKLESFVTMDGTVENFVLLPYGITSRENVQENPRLASSYYGGSLSISYSSYEASNNYPAPYEIPENSVFEITLTPEGETNSGSQSLVIRKTAGFQGYFRINNIPIGRYQINVKLNGKPLKMKLNKPWEGVFGMLPKETTGTATVSFSPGSAQANMVTPHVGGWDPVEISVTRP